MKTSLSSDAIRPLLEPLHEANAALARQYPGESGKRQPVHTVYGGAHLFRADSTRKLGALARQALDRFAPNFAVFARALGLPFAENLPRSAEEITKLESRYASDPSLLRRDNHPAWLALTICDRVRRKLQREPVEDYRIDFEDGYGNRPSSEEDGHAVAVASELVKGIEAASLPPFIGIRIKPFTEELRERSIRTLDLVLTNVTSQAQGRLPDNFVVTLPKVSIPEQVAALVRIFELLESRLGLEHGSLKMELMVETTQSLFNHRGECALPKLVEAAEGRCTGAHFGTYDYTASCNITAAHQHMTHAACDFARNVMQVALAGTGVWLSDGATNIMPAPPHRAAEGSALSAEQEEENRSAVHRAWKLHYDHVQHSLVNAFYQGWDLHPAQLPTRYAAVYTFFLEGLDAAAERLRNFVQKAAQATLVGDVFDDAATGQGLLNYFLRAINSGALTEEETLNLTSLTLDELRSRSFVNILKHRQQSRPA